MEDKRKCQRFIFIEDIAVDGLEQYASGDISETGLFVSAIQAFEINRIVEVTIPFKGEKLILKGEVKHCEPSIGFGLMFINLNDEQKVKINGLIKSLVNKPTL